MIDEDFAPIVRSTIEKWLSQDEIQNIQKLLDYYPNQIAAKLAQDVLQELSQNGYSGSDVKLAALSKPFWHLRSIFDPSQLPSTPLDFIPIPSSYSTITARLCALVVHTLIGLETISYKSENNGHLFVNLVTMPDEHVLAQKSRESMSGHTDAVSFPFRNEHDSVYPKMAPSPDFVCLAGLRNPNSVPTTVMALEDVLRRMSPNDIAELKKAQFTIRSQKTFIQGMREVLGEDHVVLEGVILLEISENEMWVRYSHSSVLVESDKETGQAHDAVRAFEYACKLSVQPIVVNPGDILLVNNRIGLHGRAEVGNDFGDTSRWLIRTYGLDTNGLLKSKRYSSPDYVLYP